MPTMASAPLHFHFAWWCGTLCGLTLPTMLTGSFVLSFDMGGSVPGFVVKKASLERGKAVLAVKRHMLKVRVGTFLALA